MSLPRVHLVQQQIRPSSPQQARDEARALIHAASPAAGDMIVLCELFSTGFRFDDADLREQGPKDHAFAIALAQELRCTVIAGHAHAAAGNAEGGSLHNVVTIAGPRGLLGHYAKVHTFGPGQEHRAFARGTSIPLFRWEATGLLVQPAICYDLRFAELFRAGNAAGAEMIVIASAWPSVRVAHWRALLIARAIENQALVAACNAVGNCPAPLPASDGTRPLIAHPGNSLVVNHLGETIADAGNNACVVSAPADASAVRAWRERFPINNDRAALSSAMVQFLV